MKAMESEAKSYYFLVSKGGLEEKLKFLVSFGFT
jgi:hypothetical protein